MAAAKASEGRAPRPRLTRAGPRISPSRPPMQKPAFSIPSSASACPKPMQQGLPQQGWEPKATSASPN